MSHVNLVNLNVVQTHIHSTTVKDGDAKEIAEQGKLAIRGLWFFACSLQLHEELCF